MLHDHSVRSVALLLALGLAPSVLTAQIETKRPAGVSKAAEKAIRRGLQFLQRKQGADGSWRTNGGYGTYPTAMTALAGTALLASGSTPTRGRYWQTVRRATDHLLRAAQPDGLITSPREEAVPMYGHGFATLFLAEVYGMEEDDRRLQQIQKSLHRAVTLTAQSQSDRGGWIYTPDSTRDEGSVTVTQIQALRACRNAGISVSPKTIARGVGYIKQSANPDGGIRYEAGAQGPSQPAITAAAVAVLYNAGRYDDPMAEKALKFARRLLPINGSNNYHYYAHLYLAQALFQRGGKDWDDYYLEMSNWLVGQQSQDGSWQGDHVGTTYGTAVALIILQLPYAYLPIYQR